MLYKARPKVIEFFDDYYSMVSEANLQAIKGTGFKILTPKRMLQRLPITLARIKAGNNYNMLLLVQELLVMFQAFVQELIFVNSQSLLNEIRQIVCFLYQSKEITKKVYNNIIKLI